MANVLGAQPGQIKRIRKKDEQFSLVDVASLITGKDAKYAHQQFQITVDGHPEVSEKIGYLKFPGRGQRETPVGDIYVVVEVIMLLPGRTAQKEWFRSSEPLQYSIK